MLVAHLNIAGGAGQTTLARHMTAIFACYAPDLETNRVAIGETHDKSAREGIRCDSLKQVPAIRWLLSNLVGSLSIDLAPAAARELAQYPLWCKDVDWWIVPVTPDAAAQRGAVATVDLLRSVGVPMQRIALVFNRIPEGVDVQADFPKIFALRHVGVFVCDAPMREHPVLRRVDEQSDSEALYRIGSYAVEPKPGESISDLQHGARAAVAAVDNLKTVWGALPIWEDLEARLPARKAA